MASTRENVTAVPRPEQNRGWRAGVAGVAGGRVSRPSGAGKASAMSCPARTPDGRYIIVNGRRWRASDPGLSEERRIELVHELMSARRAVGAATRDGNAAAERAARDRVHQAKVALGERGVPWWERPRS